MVGVCVLSSSTHIISNESWREVTSMIVIETDKRFYELRLLSLLSTELIIVRMDGLCSLIVGKIHGAGKLE